MDAPRLLVTGCGRSGTGYLAALLAELGLPCGHEVVYGPELLAGAPPAWPEGARAESSWLAGPHLRALPPGTRIVHLVREPLAVVRSCLRVRFLESARNPYRMHAERHAPGVSEGAPPVRCARYWTRWHALVEREALASGLRWRRVRLEALDAAWLVELGRGLGLGWTTADVEAALARVPRDTNTSGARGRDRLEDLAALPAAERAALEALAARYGYAGGRAACAPALARGS